MPILHRFRDINTSLPKIKTSRDLNLKFVIITRLTLLASTRAQSLTILTSAISEIFKGV